MLYSLIKQALFQIDPERAHQLTLQQLKRITDTPLAWLVRQSLPDKTVNCMGITFKNPLGLAAGLDKNGECINTLSSMGFGFIEVGTVTPRAQFGNEKPRLFRVTKADSLINRMGFNNYGVDNLVENIKKSCFKGVLGISVGKNKNTPIEKSKDDYLTCIEKVYPYADYIAINISSPNTSELRILQFGEALNDLLQAIKHKQASLKSHYCKYIPIVIKISPDLTEEDLIQVADSLVRYNVDGVIATNTTTERELVQGLNHSCQAGGLSGRALQSRSTKVIQKLFIELQGKLPIIGVGGIDSLIAAREKIVVGASLIQIYSGLIYHGPRLVKDIVCNI